MSEYEMDIEQDGGEIAGTSDGPAWSNLVAGALVGLVVGGALALLFAPKSGSEVRTDIGDAVDNIRDKAEQTLDALQETTSDLIARSRTALDQTRENLVRSVEAGRDAYEQKRDELTAQLDSPSRETSS